MKKQPIIICLAMVITTIAVVSIIQGNQASSDSSSSGGETSSDTLSHSHSHSGTSSDVNKGPERTLKSQGTENPAAKARKTNHWERKLRPFEVVRSSDRFEWTGEDGKSDAVIEVLANNDKMVEYFQNVNEWTKRRQLIYVDPQFTADIKSVFDSESNEITLPGFDGEEFTVELNLNATRGDSSELSGSLRGAIPDIEGARVVGGADSDTWAFGIYLPDRQYQIQSRENGEFIISEIDVAARNATIVHDHDHRSPDDVGAPVDN